MYYAPHHFIFLPLMIILTGIGGWKLLDTTDDKLVWLLFTIHSFCIVYLAVMTRQHYALGNQDRIIRLEFRQRYFEITGKRSSVVEKQLSFSQIAALRFCADAEFEDLVSEAITNKISGDEIKRKIMQWQPDTMRV